MPKDITLADPETVNRVLDLLELASLKTRIEDDKISPYISFQEAGRKYGIAIIKAWKDEGLIKFIQDKPKGKIRIDRLRLEVVAKDSNRGR